MTFSEQEIGFREADRRYAELKRQWDAGDISDEEFDAQLKQLMVQDDEGRWWAKSRNTGKWHYHDGSAWIQDTPPGYQRPPTLPDESPPEPQLSLDRDENSSFSETALSENTSLQDREEQSRRMPHLLIAGLLAMFLVAGIVVWMLIPGSSPEEASVAGYQLFKHDSEALWVEVPSEWDERVVVDVEGEKGRAAWSAYLGDGESAGPSMTAVNDLNSWRTGTVGHQGIYMVASKKLAQQYTDEDLVATGPNDYSSSCEAGTIQDFDRPPYSGKQLEWTNCGGESGHNVITVAAAPEDRECVVVLQTGGYLQIDDERLQHVLDTFQTDCGKIS